MFGSEDEEGDAGLLGEVAEAVPGGGGDFAEFFERVELEIEDEEGEVAIVEKEVGAADGFIGIVTTDPEEAGAGGGAVRGGIEGVAAIDEGERGSVQCTVFSIQWGVFSIQWRRVLFALEEFGEDEGESGSGAGGREFGEGAGGKGGELRGAANRSGGRFGLMRFGKLLLQVLAQGLEIQRHRGSVLLLRVLMNSIPGEGNGKREIARSGRAQGFRWVSCSARSDVNNSRRGTIDTLKVRT